MSWVRRKEYCKETIYTICHGHSVLSGVSRFTESNASVITGTTSKSSTKQKQTNNINNITVKMCKKKKCLSNIHNTIALLKCNVCTCFVFEMRQIWLSCRYLRAPEKRQDTKSPGIPGMCPRTSSTNSGSNYGKIKK